MCAGIYSVTVEIRDCGEQKRDLERRWSFKLFFYLKQKIILFNIQVYEHKFGADKL